MKKCVCGLWSIMPGMYEGHSHWCEIKPEDKPTHKEPEAPPVPPDDRKEFPIVDFTHGLFIHTNVSCMDK